MKIMEEIRKKGEHLRRNNQLNMILVGKKIGLKR